MSTITWVDVAKIIAPAAPTLGGILGGFIPVPGGALIGQAVGAAIARQFGVPATPDSVHAALQSSSDEVAKAKLQAATAEMVSTNETIAAIEAAREHRDEVFVSQVNMTMQAEVARPHWFFTGWRAANGWLLFALGVAVGAVLVAALVQTLFGSTAALVAISAALGTILAIMAVPAGVVGVTSFRPPEGVMAAAPPATAPVPVAKPPPRK